MASEEVTVIVLDDGPEAQTTPWGWRGDIVFRGRWDAKPQEIARVTSERLSTGLTLHAVVHHHGRTWVVLRSVTEYRLLRPEHASSSPPSEIRKRPQLRPAAGYR